MATKVKPQPVTLSVVRRGKTFAYELESELDWGVLYETLLEIKSANPTGKYYWTLDSVTLWIVTPRSSLNGHA